MIKRSIYLPIVFSLLIVLGIFIGASLDFSADKKNVFQVSISKYKKVENILDYIEQEYVDTINRVLLEDQTLTTLLENLDPHSAYIPAKNLAALNESLNGNFEGVGIEFSIMNDTICVLSAIEGGPSEKLGIAAGDKIIRIEEDTVAGKGITNELVMNRLRGESGSNVKVSILKSCSKQMLDYTIHRGQIPIKSVEAAYMANEKTGYIKISRFGASTYDEYLSAFEKLSRQGMSSLILDLRRNPGGYLNAAIDLADEFLKDGLQIVYTQGRAHPKKIFKASHQGNFEEQPLVVLIDEGSASASEIIAGAIQDNDRGIIVGRRSFGKGLVQEQTAFKDGSAVRLTIARYYTPTGRCIQKPYENGAEEDYYKEELKRYEHGELYHADSIQFSDSLKYITPGGKVVYGGGGIMPDVFVALDTNGFSNYVMALNKRNLFTQFAFQYSCNVNYKNFQDFNRNFKIDDQLLNELAAYAKKQGIKEKPNDAAASKNISKQLLKAAIARILWKEEGYHPVLNSYDPAFLKALSLLN